MPTIRLAALALLAAASLAFAPLPFPKPAKPARMAEESLLGDWHNPANRSVVVNITPTEFAYVNGGSRNNIYKLTLDAAKPPFKYDIRKPGAEFVGIWKIEGDKLTLLYVGERKDLPDGSRPMSFEGSGHREIYFRVAGKK